MGALESFRFPPFAPGQDISNTTGAPAPCGFYPDVYGNNAYFNNLCVGESAVLPAHTGNIGFATPQAYNDSPNFDPVNWPPAPPTQIAFFNNSGFFVPGPGGGFSPNFAGIWLLSLNPIFVGGSPNWGIAWTKNGVIQNALTDQTSLVLSWVFFANLAIGDIVSAEIANTSGPTTLNEFTIEFGYIGHA
jgi:hypothetical protein